MKNFILSNKKFLLSVLVFIIIATMYYFYKDINTDKTLDDKEVVYVVLRNGEISKGLPDLVEEFNEVNEDIYIDLSLLDVDYNNILTTRLTNEREVDIFQYTSKTLIEKDFILPLDEIGIDYSNIREDVYFKYNDDVIGIKYGSSMPKLMYNEEILKDAGLSNVNKPETVDELIEMLEQIKSNVKDVVPLNISIANIHDLFSLLGEMAVTEDTIYTTFWNYKTGEYDYDALLPVLERFRYMYKNDLINIDFDKKTDKSIFDDFEKRKSAITYTVSYKKYSVVSKSFNIDISFSDIPQISKKDNKKYYYTNSRILSIANNGREKEKFNSEELKAFNKHEEAVKTVYEWLLDKETINYLNFYNANYATFGDVSLSVNKIYDQLNTDDGYNQNVYDPTEVLAGNSTILQNCVYSVIKGNQNISTEIERLNSEMNNYINSNIRNKDINFNNYKE